MTQTQTKYRFSGHETFPLKYGWLEKLTHFLNEKAISDDFITDDLKAEYRAVDFGLGLNMAKSLKHWACATQVLEEKDKKFTYSLTGDLIFGKDGKDKYIENINTIWFLHWKLATNNTYFSTWTWFYNNFSETQFDREQLLGDLNAYIHNVGLKVSEVSLKRDIDCFIRSYINNKDDELGSPFSELNLIRIDGTNKYSSERSNKDSLATELIVISTIYFIYHHNITSTSISLDKLLYEPYSPGCIFRLNSDELILHLEKVNVLTDEAISLDVSSGISQVVITDKSILNSENFLEIEKKYLSKIYE